MAQKLMKYVEKAATMVGRAAVWKIFNYSLITCKFEHRLKLHKAKPNMSTFFKAEFHVNYAGVFKSLCFGTFIVLFFLGKRAKISL